MAGPREATHLLADLDDTLYRCPEIPAGVKRRIGGAAPARRPPPPPPPLPGPLIPPRTPPPSPPRAQRLSWGTETVWTAGTDQAPDQSIWSRSWGFPRRKWRAGCPSCITNTGRRSRAW